LTAKAVPWLTSLLGRKPLANAFGVKSLLNPNPTAKASQFRQTT
jgi:hypothetical protein